MVLLGLRNSYKDDIKTSAAEMVYGTTLRVPGEYFADEEPMGCPEMFVQKLRERMRQMRETPTAHHIKQRIFRHKELEDCTHVFVRVDRPRRPLEQPYEGPFPVIQRLTDFLYRINYKGQPTEVNVDRLKPAFMEETEEAQQPALDNAIPGPSTGEIRKEQPVRRIRFTTP